jgi:hypothetical protein
MPAHEDRRETMFGGRPRAAWSHSMDIRWISPSAIETFT